MKTLKWIYNLGKLHERRRIELAIKNYRYENPGQFVPLTEEQQSIKDFVDGDIHALLNPVRTEYVEKSVLDD